MIYLTSSPNDSDLLPLFSNIGVPHCPMPLPHGDFCWFGWWWEGEEIKVCGDRKKLGDLARCMGDGRHLQQVQDAHQAGFKFAFLIPEGDWRYGKRSGLVEVPRGKEWVPLIPNTQNSHWRAYLDEIEWYLGVKVRYTRSARETVQTVVGLWSMFQQRPEEHKSLHLFHEPQAPTGVLKRPSLLRRTVNQWPGIGWERSQAVEERAREKKQGLKEVVWWSEEEWMEVEGVGKKTAAGVWWALESSWKGG